jgi:hypothetical protein
MAILGNKKQILLNQVKRQPIEDIRQLVSLIHKYEDLEPEDFRGYISEDLFKQLMDALRDPREILMWERILAASRETPEEINAVLNDLREYLNRYPESPVKEDAIQMINEKKREIILQERARREQEREVKYYSPLPQQRCPSPSPEPEDNCRVSHRPQQQQRGTTYEPRTHKSWWQQIKFWNRKDERQEVYSSVFAPAEISPGRNMLIQVYLHLAKEEKKVISLAQEAQKDAIRKGYDTLSQFLKVGEIVNVALNIYGSQGTLFQDEKSIQWKGHFSKCDFRYFIPQGLKDDELSCELIFRMNGIPFPVGEMTFISSIIENPRELNANMYSKSYRHAFVSYAHKDGSEVELIIKTLKAIGIQFFFDKITLSAGDVFNEVIMENIDKSDLFILCWSKNSADSKYVHKEVERALPRAYPQVKPRDVATLKFYPISIEPVEDLPDYLKDIYHFESIYTK